MSKHLDVGIQCPKERPENPFWSGWPYFPPFGPCRGQIWRDRVTQFHFYHLFHPFYISANTPCSEVNFCYNNTTNFTQGGKR